MKGRIVIRFIILVTLMFFVGGILMVINGLHQLDKLFSAIESNDYIMAQAAIDDGAWVNCRKHLLYAPNLIPTNPTPLIMACKKGNVEIVKLLLKNGADINKKDNFTDQTPLLAALHGEKQNRFSLAMYLIENGADIHAVQEGVSSPLYKALYISESDGQQTILEGTLLV